MKREKRRKGEERMGRKVEKTDYFQEREEKRIRRWKNGEIDGQWPSLIPFPLPVSD